MTRALLRALVSAVGVAAVAAAALAEVIAARRESVR